MRIQLIRGLRGVSAADAGRLMVAYEPVWVIGAGGTPAAPPDYAGESTRFFDRPSAPCSGPAGAEIPPAVRWQRQFGKLRPAGLAAGGRRLFIGRSAWEPAGFFTVLSKRSCRSLV